MQTKKIKIKVDGSYAIATLIIAQNEITFKYNSYSIIKSGEYPFVILKDIRKELDGKNIFLLINGSRKDVFPSGMSLVGNMAYVQSLGEPTSLDHLVDIFDETDRIDLIDTVEEQKKYHDEWINSIR
jgi:hypothetical protein